LPPLHADFFCARVLSGRALKISLLRHSWKYPVACNLERLCQFWTGNRLQCPCSRHHFHHKL
jgi:hypothetical protein